MHTGRTIFAQIMDYLPMHTFRQCVAAYGGDFKVQHFSCRDQFLIMAFAQLTFRESLRDIEACLRAQQHHLYHMGIRSRVARNTLSHANMVRDWRIYESFAQTLIRTARTLYQADPLGVELDNTVYALDATTIDLCLSLFPWARFRKAKGGIKLHTLLDLRGNIPTFIRISDAKLHDVNILDAIVPEAGAFYIMDRAYTDFARLRRIHQDNAFFVIRARRNLRTIHRLSQPIDKTTAVRSDQHIMLKSFYSLKGYPTILRRISLYDAERKKRLVFLTNNFALPARTITDLYRCRWQVELFFKWIKQHLRIKAFYGVSENAVKTQIWIAVSIYVLVAIIKKRLAIELSLYAILQILSVSLFEKIPLFQALTQIEVSDLDQDSHNQLNLWD